MNVLFCENNSSGTSSPFIVDRLCGKIFHGGYYQQKACLRKSPKKNNSRGDSLQLIVEHRNLHPSQLLSALLDDVILHFDWLLTTLYENRQQSIKIDPSTTIY